VGLYHRIAAGTDYASKQNSLQCDYDPGTSRAPRIQTYYKLVTTTTLRPIIESKISF